jgi:hypothetical protein
VGVHVAGKRENAKRVVIVRLLERNWCKIMTGNFFGPTGCKECDRPADSFTIGDGKCNVCHGSGIANFYGAAASLAFGEETNNCERCGGSGVCPRCGGAGEY